MSELYSGRVWCAWYHDNVSLVDGHGKSLRIEQYYEIDVILSMKHLDIYIMNRANNICNQFYWLIWLAIILGVIFWKVWASSISLCLLERENLCRIQRRPNSLSLHHFDEAMNFFDGKTEFSYKCSLMIDLFIPKFSKSEEWLHSPQEWRCNSMQDKWY